jgi:hypothetical protein
MEIPLHIWLQHIWEAIVTLAPVAALATLTLLLTINEKR